MVTVAAGTDNGYDLAFRADYAADRVEHVHECVGGVGVVHDSSQSPFGAEGLETARNGIEAAHVDKHLFGIEAGQDRGAIDSGQVVGVETAGEIDLHLMAVEGQQGAVETAFKHTSAEVSVCAQGVCVDFCRCVLDHIKTCLVVGVHECESVRFERVEEHLLGVHVVFDRLVIVEVIACKIGEHTAGEMQAGYTVLGCGMARNLHKGVVTTLGHHDGQQTIEGQRLGGGVGRRFGTVADIVADGREQTGLVAFETSHLIEESGCGGLSVSTGDTYKFQLTRGVTVPGRGEFTERYGRVLDFDIGDSLLELGREVFADDGSDVGGGHDGNVAVAVGGHAADSDEHTVFDGLTRIAQESDDIFIGFTDYLDSFDFLQKLGQFHSHNCIDLTDPGEGYLGQDTYLTQLSVKLAIFFRKSPL